MFNSNLSYINYDLKSQKFVYNKGQTFDKEKYKQEQLDRAYASALKILENWNSGTGYKTASLAYLKELGLNSDKWSLRNKMIMLLNNTNDARTLKQWEAVGRSIIGGTHGFDILAPNEFFITEINKETNKEEKRKVLSGFKSVRVHPIENTKGKDVVYQEEYKKLPLLSEVAKKWNIKISYSARNAKLLNSYGYFQRSKDNTNQEIVLGTKDEFIFFHELIHAAHLRLGSLDKDSKQEKETLAQFGACVISDMYNIDCRDFTYSYINNVNGHDKKETVKYVMGLISKLQKILNLIFEVKADHESERIE